MSETSLLCKVFELFGCKLWPSIRPERVGYSCTAEGCSKSRDKLCGCCLAFHWYDLWPVQVAVYEDEVLMTGVGAKVASHFSEWSAGGDLVIIGSWGFDGSRSWQVLHERTRFPMSLSMPGQ